MAESVNYSDYSVFVRQQPVAARACGSADRPDRRPIDPIVILQLRRNALTELFADEDTSSFFAIATLVDDTAAATAAQAEGSAWSGERGPQPLASNLLTGTTLSSIFYLKDPARANQAAAFFVFSNLNVRSEGSYCLRFDVFGRSRMNVSNVAHCFSDVFTVYSAKRFPGMSNSTELSKTFSDQGLKIRIRKDIRIRKKPRLGLENDCPDLPVPYQRPEAISDGPNYARRPHDLGYVSRNSTDVSIRRSLDSDPSTESPAAPLHFHTSRGHGHTEHRKYPAPPPPPSRRPPLALHTPECDMFPDPSTYDHHDDRPRKHPEEQAPRGSTTTGGRLVQHSGHGKVSHAYHNPPHMHWKANTNNDHNNNFSTHRTSFMASDIRKLADLSTIGMPTSPYPHDHHSLRTFLPTEPDESLISHPRLPSFGESFPAFHPAPTHIGTFSSSYAQTKSQSRAYR